MQRAAILSAGVTEKEEDALTNPAREDADCSMESTGIVSAPSSVQKDALNVTVVTVKMPTIKTGKTDVLGQYNIRK